MKLVTVNISRNVKVSLKCQLKKLSLTELKEVKEFVDAKFNAEKVKRISEIKTELSALNVYMNRLNRAKRVRTKALSQLV
jgi:hypothetical protein